MIANVLATCSGSMRSKTLSNLARAGGCAVLLMGLTAVRANAEPMIVDCFGFESSCNATFDADNEVADYIFDDYVFRLGFDEILGESSFTIHMEDFLLGQFSDPPYIIGFEDRVGETFSNFKCVEITSSDEVPFCVEFVASGAYETDLPVAGEDYSNEGDGFGINVGIAYLIEGWPNPGFDPVDIGQADNFTSFISASDGEVFRLLHAVGDSDTFTDNITYQGNNGHCGLDALGATSAALDACAAQKGFSFDSPSPVPEPASILLLGPGLAGLVAMRRRRRG